MHAHIETVKAMLGLKKDREFASLFKDEKSARTVRLWKRHGMSGYALRELIEICKARGIELEPEVQLGLSLGVPKEPQRQDAA